MYVVSALAPKFNFHKRLHFDGNNRGNVIGPLALPSWDNAQESWLVKNKEKKDLLGKAGFVLVGGTPEGVCEADRERLSKQGRNKSPTDEEPAFYHSLPTILDEEWIHSYDLDALIGLAIGEGSLCMAAIRANKPCFCLTLTEYHSVHLTRRLEGLVWEAFQTEGDALYEPGLVEILAELKGEGEDNNSDNKNKPPMKRRRGKKGTKPDGEDPPPDGVDGNDGKDESKMTKKELLEAPQKAKAKKPKTQPEEEEEEEQEDSQSEDK